MKIKRLLIASPAKGGLPLSYPVLMEQLIRHPIAGWDVDFTVEAANSALNISRCVLAATAISKNYDRTIQLDLDHPICRDHVVRILSHDHETVPIVSGLYCIKRPGKPFFLGIRAKGSKPDANHLLEARFLPTGFLSISVDALRKIAAFHPDREVYVQDDVLLPPNQKRTASTMVELFPIGACGGRTAAARFRRIKKIVEPVIEKGGIGFFAKHHVQEMLGRVISEVTQEHEPGSLVGEDYGFGYLANLAGIKQYIDVACMIPHRGEINFPITDPSMVASTCDQIPEHEADLTLW